MACIGFFLGLLSCTILTTDTSPTLLKPYKKQPVKYWVQVLQAEQDPIAAYPDTISFSVTEINGSPITGIDDLKLAVKKTMALNVTHSMLKVYYHCSNSGQWAQSNVTGEALKVNWGGFFEKEDSSLCLPILPFYLAYVHAMVLCAEVVGSQMLGCCLV